MIAKRGNSSTTSTLIIGIVLLLAAAFLWRVWVYYGQIRSGSSVALPQFIGQFTAAAAAASTTSDQADVATADDPAIGPADAKLTVVEFLDYQCPYCGAESSVVRELAAAHGDKVRFIVRDFPVPSLHPDALASAEAAGCAEAQGKFWPMHDRLFALKGVLTEQAIATAAGQAGLDLAKFHACQDSHVRLKEIQEDAQAGTAAGVRGTPTFFLNGKKIEGVIPQDVFESLIQRFISS